MRKTFFAGLVGSTGIVLLALAACGGAAADAEIITLQYACINRIFKPCQLVESTFVPMVDEATDGRVQIQVTSFPESPDSTHGNPYHKLPGKEDEGVEHGRVHVRRHSFGGLEHGSRYVLSSGESHGIP